MRQWTNADPKEYISTKFQSQFKHFYSRKCIWLCRLPKGGHFTAGLICYSKLDLYQSGYIGIRHITPVMHNHSALVVPNDMLGRHQNFLCRFATNITQMFLWDTKCVLSTWITFMATEVMILWSSSMTFWDLLQTTSDAGSLKYPGMGCVNKKERVALWK